MLHLPTHQRALRYAAVLAAGCIAAVLCALGGALATGNGLLLGAALQANSAISGTVNTGIFAGTGANQLAQPSNESGFDQFLNGITSATQSINDLTYGIGDATRDMTLQNRTIPTSCGLVGGSSTLCVPEVPFCAGGNCHSAAETAAATSDYINADILRTGTAIEALQFWLNFALVFLFVAAVAANMYGGYQMLLATAGGSYDKGKEIVIAATAGMVLISLAYGIVNTVLAWNTTDVM